MRFSGMGVNKPNTDAIVKTIQDNKIGVDDVLFLGGEPCLYLHDLIECVERLKSTTSLKLFVTTAVPKICYDNFDRFEYLVRMLDGINLSVQHHNEAIADEIRKTKSQYDRQSFYNSLPMKEKIRINLNIVAPYLYSKQDITDCLVHYDKMGFNSIKLSEIQHGKDVYVSFADTFGLKMKSPYTHGCQTYIDMNEIIQGFKTPLLLKRSCFMCEESLNATIGDAVKVVGKLFKSPKNKYGVIYGDGTLTKGWV